MAKSKKTSPKRGSQPTPDSWFALHLSVLARIAFIVVVTTIAYLPSWHGGFILDDDALLTENALVHAPDGLYRMWFTTQAEDYWPLTYSTFWLEWRVWGNNPTGYHLVNLALHISAALLIWAILNRLSIPGGFIAALLFALHPVNVESVAWISQRKNTLALLFFLLSIFWYLKFDPSLIGRTTQFERSAQSTQSRFVPWFWLSLLAFVLACLSKGSVVILPAILLGLIWWRRSITKVDLFRIAPFLVVAAVVTAINVWFQSMNFTESIRDANFTERMLGAGAAVWFYLFKALWPFDLAFIYPHWHIQTDRIIWWLPLLAAIVVSAVLWWQRQISWGRPLLLAWFFFCVALFPVMGFTDVGFMKFSLVADHYQHIAIISILALLAAAWWLWLQKSDGLLQVMPLGVAASVVAVFVALTWQQSAQYRNAKAIYQSSLEKNPDSWLLHGNLGQNLLDTGEVDAAIGQLSEALRLNPNSYDAHYNLGSAYTKRHQLADAITQFKDAIRLKPDMFAAYHDLTIIYSQTDRPAEALATAEKALAIAHSCGMDELAQQIEQWKTSFKARQSSSPESKKHD